MRRKGEARLPGDRRTTLGIALALVALAAAPYASSLGHGFVHDDHMVVVDNPLVVEERFLGAFVRPYHTGPGPATGLYRPLTTGTLALNHALGGLSPGGYHALNVLLHAAVSLAVFALALAGGVSTAAAALAAALFAVHPVHVEAVAYVSGRADLLAALFFVLALVAWARGTHAGSLTAGAAFLLALLSKESAVTFPLVVLAWEALERTRSATGMRRGRGGRAVKVLALALPLAVYLLLRQRALGGFWIEPGGVTFIENPALGQGILVRVATALSVLPRAALLLLFPLRLSPDYSYAEIVPVRSALDLPFLAGVVVAALGVAALGVACSRARRACFPILFTLATYSIVSNLVVGIGTIFAERLLYLPSLGICLLGGSALAWAARALPRRAGLLVAAVLLAAAVTRTATWSAVWRDDFSLYSAAYRSAPRSVKVLGNYAAGLAFRGRLAEARELLVEALELAPESIPNRFNLAQVLFRMNDWEGAEREIRRVLAAEPGDATAWAHLGAVLQRKGELPGAEEGFRRALALQPDHPDARLGMAWLALQDGDLDRAEAELRKVLARDPEHSGALHGMGIVELRRGRPAEALAWFEKAARRSPLDLLLLTHLAQALEGLGRAGQAAEVYRRILAVDPGQEEARQGLRGLTPAGSPGATAPPGGGSSRD